MNRRNFLNKFGAAVLGTVIALKIPDTIAPHSLVGRNSYEDIMRMIDDEMDAAMKSINQQMDKYIWGLSY